MLLSLPVSAVARCARGGGGAQSASAVVRRSRLSAGAGARAKPLRLAASRCARAPFSATAPGRATPRPRLQDKVAIVTGASSGLGRAIALAYASHGARLVVCADLRADPGELEVGSGNQANVTLEVHGAAAAAADIVVGGGEDGFDETSFAGVATHELLQRRYGEGKAVFVQTDVGVEEQMRKVVAEAVERGGGRLDIVVNNAGLGNAAGSPLIHELEQKDWERTMRVNSTGVYLGCKHALGQFLKQDLNEQGRRGWIVNVSSMLGYVGLKGGTAAYCASKGAVLNLTRQVALDYAKHRIHCNALCPGFTKTSMTRANYENKDINREMIATTPWGEWGRAEDVAKAAVFLASDDAAWVTGVGLPVDGGYLAQ